MKNTQTENIYTAEQGDYLKNNPEWHVEDSPWKAAQIMRMLEANPIDLKSVAEVGCGAGEILNQLHGKLPQNIHYTGFDISRDAINFANSRTKERLNFKQENFLDTQQNFDLLLMIDVFEHVDDYLGFIRACKGKSDYTIFHIPLDIHVVGVMKKLMVESRKSVGHLHYFSKETALATLADCGYEVVDFFYTTGCFDLQRSMRAKISAVPRKILYTFSKDLAATVLGGFSLMVLAK